MVREREQGVYVAKEDNGKLYLKGPKPDNTDGLDLLSRRSMTLYNDPQIGHPSSGFTDEYHYSVEGEKRVVIMNYRDGCQMAKFDLLLSLDCARVEGVGPNPRKGRDQILQRSGAILQKPKGPNTYVLKIWL